MPRLSFVAGDIVSVEAERYRFRIIKILAIDEAGIYSKLFSQQFTERPLMINFDELSIPIFGPANLPITIDRFSECKPERIAYQEVKDEELRDYRIWLAEKGEYL